MESLYGLMTIVGPILLIAVLAWAVLHNRQSSAERRRSEEATRRQYDEQDAIDKAKEVH